MKHFLAAALIFSTTLAFSCTQISQPAYDPSSYYASAEGLSGTALKTELNLIIRNHTVYSYTPCVWDILAIADADPADPSKVIAFYAQRPILISNRDQGGNTPDAWNREHIWPKSHGFPDKDDHGYTDVHALRPADKSVNADRGNKDFGEATTAHWECTTCNYSSSYWEPGPEQQGDTARMVFYVATRYDGGDNSGSGDLTLVDGTTAIGSSSLGKLCDLVQWHLDDPVAAEELARNDIIYTWQGNRNPFIDHPEYVIPIWGEQCGISAPEPEETVPFLPIWGLLSLPLALVALALRKR